MTAVHFPIGTALWFQYGDFGDSRSHPRTSMGGGGGVVSILVSEPIFF